jgi:hypothetical protein
MYYEFIDNSIGFSKCVDRSTLEHQSLWGKAELRIVSNDKILGTFKRYEDFLAWEEMVERTHWLPKFSIDASKYYFCYKYGKRDPIPIAMENINESTFKGIGYIGISTLDGHTLDVLSYECFIKFCQGEDLMKSEIMSAVSPKHYKGYIGDLQWIDAMSRIPTLKDPVKFEAAVELQIRKYLDRNGQKDAEIQELSKALFYLKYLIAYKHAKRPITVSEVDEILGTI